MKKNLAIAIASIVASLSSLPLLADDYHAESIFAGKKLSGCYKVVRAAMEESTADATRVIGTYKYTIVPMQGKKRAFTFSGPIGGSEAADAHEDGEETTEGEGEGELHGGHVLGTKNRIGTLITAGDEFKATQASCPDANGNPRLIQGIETLKFIGGTGIFSGLKSGSIPFNVTFDACTDPSNPIGDLYASSGELCFE
jgi:hypothetical protein